MMNTKEVLLEEIRKIMVKYGYQCRDMADEIVQAALNSQEGKSVSAGFAIVPIEPTEEMVSAYVTYMEESPYEPPYVTSIQGRYQAMLAAAPSTESQPPQVDRVRELSDAIKNNVRAFRNKSSGDIQYVLIGSDDGWEEVMIIPNISNEAIDAAMKEPNTLEGEAK